MPTVPLSSTKPATKLAPTLRILALALSATACVSALAAAMHSTKDGAFTAEQAERGKVVYDRSCKNCHQVDFYRDRLTRWQNRPVGELFEAVSTAMPADNVGSLTTKEYLDVLAYVFSITGSPAGKEELTTDTMDGVSIAAAE
jgi:mono/diheme cytochrome c family protein